MLTSGRSRISWQPPSPRSRLLREVTGSLVQETLKKSKFLLGMEIELPICAQMWHGMVANIPA
jgi:hypothetical protein